MPRIRGPTRRVWNPAHPSRGVRHRKPRGRGATWLCGHDHQNDTQLQRGGPQPNLCLSFGPRARRQRDPSAHPRRLRREGRMSGRSKPADRRYFIGGSDARIIMGNNAAALVRLWREKRGEAEPEDLSRNLVVKLGAVTEELNRRWYEANTGQAITDVQT